MTADHLIDLMVKAKINADRFEVDDQSYSVPTKRWVLGPFSESLKKEVARRGLSQPRPEANDCDDFAWRAFDWARTLNARSNPYDRAITFGVIKFYPDNAQGIGHAINVAVVDFEETVMFYEPQTYQELILTPSEHYLCLFYEF
jgi:hypothetical protein